MKKDCYLKKQLKISCFCTVKCDMIYVEKGVICMRYAAVMFDVIESRKYSERYEVQQMLMNCIDYLNGIYRDSIKKEVVSSAGDEFQGLFLDLQSAFVYIRKLQILIYPIKIRCGIGYGEIKYDVEEWTSAAFDGEAYYLARAAIVSIGKQKNNAICFASQIDEKALEQIKRMCDYDLTLGSQIRIMPDVHAGKGCTIGTTMTIKDKVCPNIVGVDIGCGMYTVKLLNKRN